jgi:hypothetical protein
LKDQAVAGKRFFEIRMISQLSGFSDTLNISQVDANVGYWQVTADFSKLNYWDIIYISKL